MRCPPPDERRSVDSGRESLPPLAQGGVVGRLGHLLCWFRSRPARAVTRCHPPPAMHWKRPDSTHQDLAPRVGAFTQRAFSNPRSPLDGQGLEPRSSMFGPRPSWIVWAPPRAAPDGGARDGWLDFSQQCPGAFGTGGGSDACERELLSREQRALPTRLGSRLPSAKEPRQGRGAFLAPLTPTFPSATSELLAAPRDGGRKGPDSSGRPRGGHQSVFRARGPVDAVSR